MTRSDQTFLLLGALGFGVWYMMRRAQAASAPATVPLQAGDWVQDSATGQWWNATTGEGPLSAPPPATIDYYPPGALQNVYL